jgi:hypothetical protein
MIDFDNVTNLEILAGEGVQICIATDFDGAHDFIAGSEEEIAELRADAVEICGCHRNHRLHR